MAGLLERPQRLTIGSCCLEVPQFIPSVSSLKTTLRVRDYLAVLNAFAWEQPRYLVSAYDLERLNPEEIDRVYPALLSTIDAGGFVLLDSGNYESYWQNAGDYWNRQRFHGILASYPSSLAFAFDYHFPWRDPETEAAEQRALFLEDRSEGAGRSVTPLIHASPHALPAACASVATNCDAAVLAVPERCLGFGLAERVHTTKQIRRELDRSGRYVALHLLGTGNPLSLALFSAAGADLFDGLEWCQTVVDVRTSFLHHLSQAEIFAPVPNNPALTRATIPLMHNLRFFDDWMRDVRAAIAAGAVGELLQSRFPPSIAQPAIAMLSEELE